MQKSERTNRIIARGEGSDHAHIIVGEATIRNENGEILIEIHGTASIKHLLESAWINGIEKWSEEHGDIDLTDMPNQIRQGDVLLDKVSEKIYKYIPQLEYDPYNEVIRAVRD